MSFAVKANTPVIGAFVDAFRFGFLDSLHLAFRIHFALGANPTPAVNILILHSYRIINNVISSAPGTLPQSSQITSFLGRGRAGNAGE